MAFDWKELGKKFVGFGAPVLGGLLAGPLGSKAGGMVAGLLGCNDDPESIEKVLSADPKIVLELKKYEMKHIEALEKLRLQGQEQELDELKAHMDNTKDARHRQIESEKATGKRDINIYILAYIVVAAFFSMMGALILKEVPELNNPIIYMSVGGLIGNLNQVFNYFFGSSKSSSDKTKLLAGK